MHHYINRKTKSVIVKRDGQQGHSYLLSLFLYGLFLLLALFLSVKYGALLQDCGWFVYLDAALIEEEQFRSMDFGEDGLAVIEASAEEHQVSLGEAAAVWMIRYGYHLPGVSAMKRHAGDFSNWKEQMIKWSEPDFRKIVNAYNTLLTGLEWFPVAEHGGQYLAPVSFDNSWLAPREYGGERLHEGCDIMSGQAPATQYADRVYPPGVYPVVSISSGVVENIGWLPLGGWRVGIRTPSGAYLYYAHLYGYAPELEKGKRVSPGELLGWMGDTGYSEVEGTAGNFAVHLHLGLYLRTDHYEELSVNPYWILRYLQQKQMTIEIRKGEQ